MAARTQTLTFKRTLSAPSQEVYRAFTNATALREWLCNAAQADPHKGGRIHLWWNSGYYATGEFTALTPGRKVAFTWFGRGEPAPTRVQVSITEKKDRVALTLTHSGVGSGKAWARTIDALERGWNVNLENLQSVLETGHDLRFTLRPLLGISSDAFDAEVAAKLGVPVSQGVRLSSVSEGLAAHEAGLQKNDVVVSIGGKKTTGVDSFIGALQAHRAGDVVKVVFYRGGEKKGVPVKLSARRLPEVPESAGALAEAARKMYAELDAELAACFDGVSEEEAAHRPAPDQWSAKDVLCHLIAGERDGHAWITELIGSQERWTDDWPGNIEVRHAGLLVAFPTAKMLLEEFQRNEIETVAMLVALPTGLVARKGSFWRLAYAVLQTPDHTREHMPQIRAAIASAHR